MGKCCSREKHPFMAINGLSKIFNNRIHALANDLGINESYRHLIFHLSRGDGITQLDLAQQTNLKPPTISITLKKMEREGFVTRVQDENDMRAVRVYLTEKGREVSRESKKLVDTIDHEAVKDLTTEEISQLISLLDRVYTNLTGEQPYARKCRKHGGNDA